MTDASIVVAGSSNTDMVIKAARLPAPGETILGGAFFMNAGGKGANQAVAAARLGGNVTFIAKLGNDIFGKQALQLFNEEGINTSCVMVDSQLPSGVALITVDESGENCIAVASGANAALMPADIEAIEDTIATAEIILMQLEIPVETVEYISALAKKYGKKLILNPAPARPLGDGVLGNISVITPNQTEAGILTGIAVTDEVTAIAAAVVLREKGIEHVIITLGENGALVYSHNEYKTVTPPKVTAVDTTAAGDVFNGALAVALCEGMNIFDAAEFACKAAAISVTRLGAQASAPGRNEIINALPS
ncbi:MAG TPA: ribokinase [Chitinophagaceae bacterium]|nr:ribokinase [Chitinophagaceae bacterium]